MAFGVKTKNIKTQNSYTIESFFDAIKDKEFTAGTPSLTKHGMATVITFPALDSQNQVWIMKSGFGKETQKFSIQKSTQAGMDNVAKNAALDSITGGLFSVGGMVSENTKKCEKLVDATANESVTKVGTIFVSIFSCQKLPFTVQLGGVRLCFLMIIIILRLAI